MIIIAVLTLLQDILPLLTAVNPAEANFTAVREVFGSKCKINWLNIQIKP